MSPLSCAAAASPNTPATGAYTSTVSTSASTLTSLISAAQASGNPYFTVRWPISTGLAAGNYILVVSVEMPDGTVQQIAAKADFDADAVG